MNNKYLSSVRRIGIRSVALIPILSFFILLNSCGGRSGHFKIEGHLLNMNQGEFYLYSPDGIINGIDTIKMNGGRFSHEIPCDKSGVIMLVFPNFSVLPIFAESGESASLEGNASHLKELRVKGTKENSLMSNFRISIADTSPAQYVKEAEKFITENPESPVSNYLFRQYFILSNTPDVMTASQLLSKMKEEQKDGQAITQLEQEFRKATAIAIGLQLPAFKATDINGVTLSETNAKDIITVIYTWASWNYESLNQQRELNRIAKQKAGQLKLIGINLDASKKVCQDAVKRDSITASIICNERMFDDPLLDRLGLFRVPENLIISKQGRIKERSLSTKDLKERLERLLK